jgi:predicted RNase H-like nuclease (RuvC/YqgF family)
MSDSNYQKEVKSIRKKCAKHKLNNQIMLNSLDMKISGLDHRISQLESHFKPKDGMLYQMNNTINEIQRRLFNHNGQVPLVAEVKNIDLELKKHLKSHNIFNLNKMRLILIIIGVIATSTLGGYLSNYTQRLIENRNVNAEQR